MISQKSTYNVISDTNNWLHSSVRRKKTKKTKKTLNHGDSDVAPFIWYKISKECDTVQSIR